MNAEKCIATFGPATDGRLWAAPSTCSQLQHRATTFFRRGPSAGTTDLYSQQARCLQSHPMFAIAEYSIGGLHHARHVLKTLGAGREQHPCRYVPRHVHVRGYQHGSLCLEAPPARAPCRPRAGALRGGVTAPPVGVAPRRLAAAAAAAAAAPLSPPHAPPATATWLHVPPCALTAMEPAGLPGTVIIRLYPSPFVYSCGQYLGSSGSTCDRLP